MSFHDAVPAAAPDMPPTHAGHKFDIVQLGERYQVICTTHDKPMTMGWLDKTRKDAEEHMKDVEAEAMRDQMFPPKHGEM